ncbi:HAMP domain-containing sensor histidine kinase [Nocardioides sp.]|uniref:sensor histidine kinase n=1 Tax=Nocardioides sp. TaxID=35761 RepID=UPI002D7FB178|nr:HAMP domain-containing sensor histidine kinase [Nocardioides sp.]HET8959071.1 HAMP domain-containing sensor histidine kinase [Nocardioides sp.]
MRRHISWLVLAATTTVVVSFVIPLCLLVQTLAEDRAMAAADQEARNVAILVTGGLVDNERVDEVVRGLDAPGGAETAVLTVDGEVLGNGDLDPDDPEVQRALGGDAFEVVDDSGGRVLLPVVNDQGTAVVRTSVEPEVLHAGVTSAWLGIVGLGLLLLALAGATAAWQGRRLAEPLREVAGTAHELRGGNLAARARVRGTAETKELARALNGLAERIRELLAAERATVGDLSHRLRTPVTALRLDAEAVKDQALARRLGDHIAVLQRSIDAIVREARRPVRTDLRSVGDFSATVRDRTAFWQVLADDQDRPTEIAIPEAALTVPVAPDDLADLVDCLIDNVFAHTPEQTAFAVRLAEEDGEVRLVVSDDGPGPATRAGDRLGSTGLGLDIARRTAVGAGGDLKFGPGEAGGTTVEVTLPLAAD